MNTLNKQLLTVNIAHQLLCKKARVSVASFTIQLTAARNSLHSNESNITDIYSICQQHRLRLQNCKNIVPNKN